MKDDATRQWLVQAASYIAASADWFAEVKSAPKSEMRWHYRTCETIHDALAGKPPPSGGHPRQYDPAEVMLRLENVAKRLRERVGEN
jgi:hypothetical protein